ncbi:hypothetical protein AAC387_Pa10g0514 [Persea americana]
MKSDPSSRDQSKFCAYHKQIGHKTDESKSFKSQLESLVREGHLRDYIEEDGRDNSRPLRRDGGGQDSKPEGIINVIHLAPPPKGSS